MDIQKEIGHDTTIQPETKISQLELKKKKPKILLCSFVLILLLFILLDDTFVFSRPSSYISIN